MSDLLDAVLAPNARMAEIRRLVRDASAKAVMAGEISLELQSGRWKDDPYVQDDLRAQIDIAWSDHDTMIVELLEHLQRAEKRGELAECEAMLTVSFGGRA